MSFLDSVNETEIFEPEVESSFRQDDLKKKFRLYRSNVELINSKYKEVKTVLDRLQEEIKISHEMEKSQKIRISLLQSQLSILEEKGVKMYEISEKQKNNSEEIRKMGTSIIELTNLIQELKEKFQVVINSTVKDIKIAKKNMDLQRLVKAKEAELNELKIGLKSSMSEKEDMIKRYAIENEQLKKEIEISKSVMNDTKEHCDKITDSYKQQIMEYERIISEMDRERKSILGDYDMGHISQYESNSSLALNSQNDKTVEQSDNATACFTIEKDEEMKPLMCSNSPLRKNKRHLHGNNQSSVVGSSKSKLSFQSSLETNHGNKVQYNFSKLGVKQKPKLNFLDSNKESSSLCPNTQSKKRLYSQNSNFYIN